MKTMEVSAKLSDGDTRERTVTIEFPENIDELIEKFGEDVVYQQARAALVVSLQGAMRGWIKGGKDGSGKKSDEEIQSLAEEWKPGTRQRGKTPQEKLREQFQSMDPDERRKLLEELMAGGAGEASEQDDAA